jgi:hypothetical protein
MDRKEYMKIAVDKFPEEARAKFINQAWSRTAVFVEINKDISGLAQAGRLVQDILVALLEDR